MKPQQAAKRQSRSQQDRGRTNVPGGNPRQNDAVDHDLYNDENRINPLGPNDWKRGGA